MHRITRWIAAAAMVSCTALPLAGCAQPAASTTKAVAPAKIEAIGGSGVKKLTLTPKAVERLALATAAVQQDGARLLIPYSALLYLPDGTTFAYTNPDKNVYLREPVTVERIQGGTAVLTAGPKVGTNVVTVGGAELWGTEFGIK